jgi:hypothetical protein
VGAVDFSIDTRLVACLQRALPISVFLETGTFEGEAIARVRDLFDEIHSIELSEHYYAQAADRFADDTRVRLYHGESSHVLNSLRPLLEDKAVLYWLDAHWCVGDETAGAHSQCPLLEELAALGRLNAKSALLIDDARLFLATPPEPHESSDWPRFQEVLQRLLALSPSHEIMVINDVIVFFPEAVLEAVSEYARSHGTDWLVELHLREVYEHAAAERLEGIEQLTAALEECKQGVPKVRGWNNLGPAALVKPIAELVRSKRRRGRMS